MPDAELGAGLRQTTDSAPGKAMVPSNCQQELGLVLFPILPQDIKGHGVRGGVTHFSAVSFYVLLKDDLMGEENYDSPTVIR